MTELDPVAVGLSVVTGIALAAAAGFRAFVPLLAAGIAIHLGFIEAAPGFSWLGHPLALAALAAATLVEVGAYYIPGVDHALDLVAAPVALLAGIIVAASVMADVPDWLRWLAAIAAGGTATAAAYSLTAFGRAKTGALSAGLSNPLFSTGELVGAAVLALLALLLPVLAALALLAIAIAAIRRWRRR